MTRPSQFSEPRENVASPYGHRWTVSSPLAQFAMELRFFIATAISINLRESARCRAVGYERVGREGPFCGLYLRHLRIKPWSADGADERRLQCAPNDQRR